MFPRALVFDLDGTLVHSLPGIAAALGRAMAALGYAPHPEPAVRGFIGDGARILATRALPAGSSDALIGRLEQAFKDDYSRTWSAATAPYPGIVGMLETLAAGGLPLAVLSNKPHPFTIAMVADLFPGIPFAAVLGQRPGIPHKPDPTGMLEIVAGLGVAPADCWMIGDSTMDLATARGSGARAVGVTWGYHDRAALAAVKPDALLDSPAELLAAVAAAVDGGYSSPSPRSLP